MTTACTDCPLRKRPCFQPMSADELAFMERFKMGEMVIDTGTPILMEGSNSPQLYTALSGMGLRSKSGRDGARQVINFVLPGDFLGLQAGLMREMGHSVESTTQMTLCVFDRSALWLLFRSHPERAFALTWLAAVEESFLGDALFTLGRRSAGERVAWALLRLFQRLSVLGMADRTSVPLPYRQQDLADALGLSLVHTNKTLAVLRREGLAEWSGGRLHVPDPAGLAARADVPEEDAADMPRPLI